MKKNTSEEAETQSLRNSYIDERTEKKIHEHLNNEDDIITEEDIANAPTGIVDKEFSKQDDVAEIVPEESEEKDDPEKRKIKDNDDPGIDTSWNVLGS